MVFGCRGGLGYEGNAKYLYIYCHRHTNFECIWITKDKKLLYELRKKGFKAEYYFSLKGILAVLRAKYVFITHSLTDVPFVFFKQETKIINLWHGIPIKCVAFCDKNLSVKARVMDWLRDKRTDIFISNSERFNTIYRKCFKVRPNSIKVVGLPRINYLRKPEDFGVNRVQSKKKILLYAPTFRDYKDYNPLFKEEFLRKLDEVIKNYNAEFWIKLHPFVNNNIIPNKPYEAIKFLPSGVDIYELLTKVHTLISDYSSIIMDFAIAFPDRNILLFCYDLEKYEKERGFAIPFKNLFRKNIHYELNDLFTSIKVILKGKKINTCSLFQKFAYNEENLGMECINLINKIKSIREV